MPPAHPATLRSRGRAGGVAGQRRTYRRTGGGAGEVPGGSRIGVRTWGVGGASPGWNARFWPEADRLLRFSTATRRGERYRGRPDAVRCVGIRHVAMALTWSSASLPLPRDRSCQRPLWAGS
ncbi:hypothetical protein [Lysobacter gummosus]|uniref:hypothetical protein n=1 Tax=Lysobacter gummosus TaxID=262324 RepID=UPI003632162F